MLIEVINTISLTKNPEFKNIKTINKNFRKINKEHCNSLLDFLYNGGLGKWQNPFTKKFLRRESPIIISFLSRCYYYMDNDNSKINIHGYNLTYKKHINKFINKEYLYVSSKKKSINSSIPNANIKSVRGGGSHSILRSKSPIGHQAGRRRKPTINAGSTFYYNPVDNEYTWQQPPLNTIDNEYTWQQPPLNTVNNVHTWQQPPLNTVDISSESQQKGNFYESRGQKFYQGNIPDHIWQLINNLGIRYLGPGKGEKGEIIEKMNKKYTDDQELFAIWEKEEETEPDKVKKEKEKYKKMENADINYFNQQLFMYDSNGKKILKARNSWF